MKRTVVTGIGLVTPLGNTTGETWSAALAGKSGVGPITHFDTSDFATKIAGEVRGLEVTRWLEAREAKHMDLFVQYGVIAAEQALADARLPKVEADEIE